MDHENEKKASCIQPIFPFEFMAPGTTLFGAGTITQIGIKASEFGTKACLVTGESSLQSSGDLARIESSLMKEGISWIHARIAYEPTIGRVEQITQQARTAQVQMVIAIGGGSVLDTGKAVAGLLGNGGCLMDYLEGVGSGKSFIKPSLPFIAAPTTSGTGSEATKNAVITADDGAFKKSIRGNALMPKIALVDPQLTRHCPMSVRAACMMDALTQLIESMLSKRATPMIRALAYQGIKAINDVLPWMLGANQHPSETFIDNNLTQLSFASYLGGICLANAGLGSVHGITGALGAFFPIPHGVACAALLPSALFINIQKALSDPNTLQTTALLDQYLHLDQILNALHPLTSNEPAKFNALLDQMLSHSFSSTQQYLRPQIRMVERLAALIFGLRMALQQMGIEGLAHYGIEPKDDARIIEDSLGASSMKTNPFELTQHDLLWILNDAR